MNFYIGLHLPYLAQHFDRCFVSINVLRRRKSDFIVRDWIMDSGAFSELNLFGHYRNSVAQYADEVNRWSKCGQMELAVTQDYMCEPFMLEKTGLTVLEHQQLTISRYDELINLTDAPIMPVLQGYQPADYLAHVLMYGNRLRGNMRVGVGSVCKRNRNPNEIVRVLETIKVIRPDLRLHGFGLKTTALLNNYICSLLYSADSMAWSYAARREGRDGNSWLEADKFNNKINNQMAIKNHQFVFSPE